MERFFSSFMLCFSEAVTCKILFNIFFKYRKKLLKINWLFVFILAASSTVLSLTCKNTYIRVSIYALLISFIYYAIYNTNILKSFICSTGYIGITICVEVPFYIILQKITEQNASNGISEDYISSTIFGLLVKFTVFIVILLINRLFGKKEYLQNLNKRNWLSFLCLPLVSTAVLLVLIFGKRNDYPIFIAMFLLLFNVLIYAYLQENGFQNKRKQELLLLEEHTKVQLQTFKDIGSIYNEQRARIHEFKNQINFIYGIIEKEDYSTLNSYVSKLKEQINLETPSIETGNSVINILINQSIKRASLKQISFFPNVHIENNLLIEDNDMVIIVSNLLNNAIEHCETLKVSKKIITFKINNTNHQLLIACSNPIERNIAIENNLIKTTKNNHFEHGLGLKNILRIVEKYNGDVSITTNDNKFKYVIMIQKQEV